MSLTIIQRDKLRNALHSRADKLRGSDARRLRRVADESRLFDAFVERIYKKFKRANPKASDGTLLKLILEFIENGGLAVIAEFIAAIFKLFSK